MLPWFTACSQFDYYRQAVQGHWDLMSRRQPIDILLKDTHTEPRLLQQLKLASEIRNFASTDLALADNGSYRSYVDLGRPYATWAVYAADEFCLEPKTWCFPIAGCVPYRGYFVKQKAEEFANGLRQAGMDVYIVSASAYSTLGWFDDPVLNTMILRGEAALAGIIFHELAHQRVYVQGDTAFNESFAVAVQEAGTRRWLQRHGTPEQRAAFEDGLQRKLVFFTLVKTARQRLAAVYASHLNDSIRREEKSAIIESMRRDYQYLRETSGGSLNYDRWFTEPINNAKLAAVAIYQGGVADFLSLLKACDGDFKKFFAEVEQISRLPSEKRLVHRHCTPVTQ
jgi:predicted aminopeptidase